MVAADDHEHVPCTVAIEIARRFGEGKVPAVGTDPAQASGPDRARIVGTLGIRGIPHGLTGRAVATDDGLAGELHDVGLAGRQLEGRGHQRERHRLFPRPVLQHAAERVQLPPEQAALVERDLVIDRLAAIDGQAIGPAEPAFSVDPEPVVAGRQGQRRLFEHLDRLAERILARLVEDLHREHRPLVDQLDSPEAPRRIAPPGTPAGEIEQRRGGEDPCRGAEHPAIRAGGSWRWFHCRAGGGHAVPVAGRRGRLSHRYALLNGHAISINSPAAYAPGTTTRYQSDRP